LSGFRSTSHHLVETHARYVLGSSSAPYSQYHKDTIGNCLWRERRSTVSLLSLPQRKFLHRCQSRRTRSFSRTWVGSLISHNALPLQIFQSGTASTLPIFDAYRGTPSWMLFVNHTRPCAGASPNNAFACLMTASSSDLLVGINAGLAIEQFPFRAVLDGPEGIMSDLPAKRLSRGAGGQIPFIAGTVLDEGPLVCSNLDGQCDYTSTGTLFIPRDFQTEDIPIWLNANYTPSPLVPDALSAGIDKVISLYSGDPGAGSPFGTGNETFGTGPGFKWGAAICKSLSSCFAKLLKQT